MNYTAYLVELYSRIHALAVFADAGDAAAREELARKRTLALVIESLSSASLAIPPIHQQGGEA